MRPVPRTRGVVFLTMSLLAASCGEQGDKDQTPPSEVEDFILPSGEILVVEADLKIEVSGRIEIEGDIVASGNNGASIELIATGDILISGSVRAGDGQGGQDGGSISMNSKEGDITLESAIELHAGDAGDSLVRDQSGAVGGSVLLEAKAGRATFPSGEAGQIHIGNGGDGLDLDVQGADILDFQSPEVRLGAGGGSGIFDVIANEIDGLGLTPFELEKDIINGAGETIFKAGVYSGIEDGPLFSGGKGGDAGAFRLGVDQDGNALGPGADVQALRLADVFVEIEVIGADGGTGFRQGGKGQDVFLAGKDGATPGAPGQAVRAQGGGGGSCGIGSFIFFIPCSTGDTGEAIAFGGNGAPGSVPGGDGGDGGGAAASSGSGGLSIQPENAGRCANSLAEGGLGGIGGAACVPTIEKGGDGGPGGSAFASNGTLFCKGPVTATARGGPGGAGGAGEPAGNGGDRGGTSSIVTDGEKSTAIEKEGADGKGGGVCPDPEPPSDQCSCNTPGVSFSPEGCEDFGDEFECSGFHSVFCSVEVNFDDPRCSEGGDEAFAGTLFDDGTLFEGFGCSIAIVCP